MGEVSCWTIPVPSLMILISGIFSRFRFIVQTQRITDRITDAARRLHVIVVRVTNYVNG